MIQKLHLYYNKIGESSKAGNSIYRSSSQECDIASTLDLLHYARCFAGLLFLVRKRLVVEFAEYFKKALTLTNTRLKNVNVG